MKTLKHSLIIAASLLMPMLAFTQNNTATTNSEKALTSDDGGTIKSNNTASGIKATSQNKKADSPDGNKYNVSKRNKKIGKMKVEQCEMKEGEAGTSRRDTKAICGPKK